jgi:TfoX/Sxy family transcriptional regulator of competence genes
MSYDEKLAARVRHALAGERKVEEKKMMGGLTFMVKGKMCVGILNDDLMARIDPAVHEEALTKKGCREMDFTGRPMKGFVFVGPDGTKRSLDYWIGLALDFNEKAKPSKKKKKKKSARLSSH